MSNDGAAQTTGGIRLPKGPLSSPARRTEVGDKADGGLLAAIPCTPWMLTLWSGKVSAGPDSGKRKQDAGKLKGPNYKPRVFDGPLHFGIPEAHL